MSEHAEVAFLKSDRVILRPILRKDIPLLLKWINDPEVRFFLDAYLPKMEADEEEWVEKIHKQKSDLIVFGIVVEGKLIGTMALHHINFKNRTAVTGAMIGEKEYWGKGYGSHAKMLLLNYAFNTLNLRKVCSSVIAYNERSYHYSLKCGYVEEGRKREQFYKGGRYWDEIFLAVFRKDWDLIWEVFKKDNSVQ